MEYFTHWPKVYAIPNKEAMMVVALMTYFSCHFRDPNEQHSAHSWNFESRLMQEVLVCLKIGKKWTTTLYPHSNCTEEKYVNRTKKYQRKVILALQRDMDKRPPYFTQAYTSSTSKTISMRPTSMVFWRELCQPYDLQFGAPPNKGQPMTNLTHQLHNPHKHLKVDRKRINSHYDCLAISMRF
jgi:hypothetical protein